MSVFKKLLDLSRAIEKKERSEATQHIAGTLQSLGLTCRCGSLAIPNQKSGNVYKCLSCDRQFANTRYDWGSYREYRSSDHEKAIELLEEKYN